MKNHEIYAIVLNEEIVNVVVAENIFQATECARTYDKELAFAVDCSDFKCGVGDFYIDNVFYYRDRETMIPNTSVESLINELKRSNKELNEHLTEMTRNYEIIENSIMTLLQNNVDIEIALCELAQLITEGEENE